MADCDKILWGMFLVSGDIKHIFSSTWTHADTLLTAEAPVVFQGKMIVRVKDEVQLLHCCSSCCSVLCDGWSNYSLKWFNITHTHMHTHPARCVMALQWHIFYDRRSAASHWLTHQTHNQTLCLCSLYMAAQVPTEVWNADLMTSWFVH